MEDRLETPGAAGMVLALDVVQRQKNRDKSGHPLIMLVFAACEVSLSSTTNTRWENISESINKK